MQNNDNIYYLNIDFMIKKSIIKDYFFEFVTIHNLQKFWIFSQICLFSIANQDLMIIKGLNAVFLKGPLLFSWLLFLLFWLIGDYINLSCSSKKYMNQMINQTSLQLIKKE